MVLLYKSVKYSLLCAAGSSVSDHRLLSEETLCICTQKVKVFAQRTVLLEALKSFLGVSMRCIRPEVNAASS